MSGWDRLDESSKQRACASLAERLVRCKGWFPPFPPTGASPSFYGVGAGDSAGDGEGASDAEPSVFGGFLFAAPVLLWRARGVGVGDAAVTAGFVVAVVPCCWQEETIDAMPIRAVIKHSVYLFIGLVSVRLPQS